MELLLLTLLYLPIFGTPHTEGNNYILEFLTVMKHTSLILVIPYSMALLILSTYFTKPAIVQTVIASPTPPPIISPKQIVFPDEKGKVVLSINWNHLLFLKSEDNYINVHYLHNDNIEKKLIRTNLKKLEKEIEHPMLIRTHRSYMVNWENVVSMDKGKKGFKLNLKKLSDIQIPISATYRKKIEARLNDLDGNLS